DLEHAAQENPTAVPPETALFVTYMRAKEFDKALDVAQRLQKALPNEPTGYDYAGLAYLAQDNKEAGRSAFLKARELKPGDPLASRSLAGLAMQEGNLDTAAQYSEEIIKANPQYVQAYVDLAEIQGRTGHS